jgi:hypothetical protein
VKSVGLPATQVRSVRCAHEVERIVQPVVVLQPPVGRISLPPLQVTGTEMHTTGSSALPSGRQRVPSAGSHAGAKPVNTAVWPRFTHCPVGVGQSVATGLPSVTQRLPFSQSGT